MSMNLRFSVRQWVLATATCLTGVSIWLFFWLLHPEWMSFQEQNQLFLWTNDYLCERLSAAGGIADWLGEFIVQFFYVEWLGSLLMALLFLVMHRLTWKSIVCGKKPKHLYISYILSLLPVIFFIYLLGDENVLVSLPVAFTLLVAFTAVLRRVRKRWWLPAAILLWWAVGTNWITYYRIPQHGPVLSGWQTDKWELLKQDYLIRHSRWEEVIERAKQHEVHTTFWSNSVNLALAVTGQLADRQFDFWQSGEDALIMPMVRDNVSNLPTAEAFWYLGMINSALRYTSDIQESILNARKSGRFEQRIAECLIINGNHVIARKHLNLLKKSLFYSSWAEEAEACMTDNQKFENHPGWGHLRDVRYKKSFLYSYAEIDKMLGILFQENTKNKVALEYFIGQLLLKGDAQTFIQALPWAQQYCNYHVMPLAYQDAVNCMQSRQVPDSPYGRYVKRKLGGQRP